MEKFHKVHLEYLSLATVMLESLQIKGNFSIKSGQVKVTGFGSIHSNIKVPVSNKSKSTIWGTLLNI